MVLMLEFSSYQKYILVRSSNVVFILKLLLKVAKYWRKGFFCCFLVVFFNASVYSLLLVAKTSMHEPILTPLCSDRTLHLTHLLQAVNFLPNYVFQKVL